MMKKSTNIRICLTALMLALLLCPFGGVVKAQKNSYNIDNGLYEMYLRANANRNNAKGVATADSMRRRAIALHDHKAEVLAMTIPLQYELQKSDNFGRVLAESEKVRSKSQKYNLLQYYFYTSAVLVNYYVEHGREKEAMDILKKDAAFAQQRDHHYGIMSAMISMGDILVNRKEFAHAVRFYNSAIGYAQQHLKPSDATPAYLKVCMTHFLHGRYLHMVRNANAGLDGADDEQSRAGLYGYMALGKFMLLDFDGYKEAYKKYAQYKHVGAIIWPEMEELLNLLPAIENGDVRKVRKYKLQAKRPYNFYASYAYYSYNKQYKKASVDMDSITATIMSGAKDDIMKDMVELFTSVNNRKMALQQQEALNEQARLELLHSKLDLNNANLLLGHAEISKRAALLEADRKKLALHNQTARAKHMQEKLKQQQRLNDMSRERQRSEEKIYYASIIFMSAVILLLLFYMLIHRRGKHRLSELSDKLTKIESELKVANAAAQDSDRQKTTFLRNMSHEIRTPLNSIVGFSEVLSEMDKKLTEDEKLDMARRITENSEMLSKLINDILDLTSIESGKYVMKYEMVAVNELCRKLIEDMEHRCKEGVAMVFDSTIGDDFSIYTDSLRVQQMLVNLLSNALKNTSKGSVTLGCSLDAHPGFVTFAVTDTGIGVPPQIMEEIFMRFHKEDAFKQGTGLGLAICRAIVTRLGGEVNLDTEYHDGARFWFTLPIANAEKEPESKPEVENSPPPSTVAKMKHRWWSKKV